MIRDKRESSGSYGKSCEGVAVFPGRRSPVRGRAHRYRYRYRYRNRDRYWDRMLPTGTRSIAIPIAIPIAKTQKKDPAEAGSWLIERRAGSVHSAHAAHAAHTVHAARGHAAILLVFGDLAHQRLGGEEQARDG